MAETEKTLGMVLGCSWWNRYCQRSVLWLIRHCGHLVHLRFTDECIRHYAGDHASITV